MVASDVEALFESELARIDQPDRVAVIRELRVPARCEDRPWNYGRPGTHPCWVVLEDPESHMAVVYCEHGFGPSFPWGVLWTAGPDLSMGRDDGWFVTLEDAARHIPAWHGENPPDYEVA